MLVIELARAMFTGSELSQSVNVVVTKSNELSIAIVKVRLTFTKHPSMSATGNCKYLNSLFTCCILVIIFKFVSFCFYNFMLHVYLYVAL